MKYCAQYHLNTTPTQRENSPPARQTKKHLVISQSHKSVSLSSSLSYEVIVSLSLAQNRPVVFFANHMVPWASEWAACCCSQWAVCVLEDLGFDTEEAGQSELSLLSARLNLSFWFSSVLLCFSSCLYPVIFPPSLICFASLSLLVWFVFLSTLGLFMFSLHSSFLLVFLSFTFLSVH